MRHELKKSDSLQEFLNDTRPRLNGEVGQANGVAGREGPINNIVLVDFWSRRYEYCRLTAPAVDYVYSIFSEKLTLLKIEIDNFPYIASEFKIRILPAQILFKNGEKIKEFMGIDTVEDHISEIEAEISKLIPVRKT